MTIKNETFMHRYCSLVPRPSSLTGIVSHEEKVKYHTGGKEEEEEKNKREEGLVKLIT